MLIFLTSFNTFIQLLTKKIWRFKRFFVPSQRKKVEIVSRPYIDYSLKNLKIWKMFLQIS